MLKFSKFQTITELFVHFFVHRYQNIAQHLDFMANYQYYPRKTPYFARQTGKTVKNFQIIVKYLLNNHCYRFNYI